MKQQDSQCMAGCVYKIDNKGEGLDSGNQINAKAAQASSYELVHRRAMVSTRQSQTASPVAT